jgi:hypothetical protein
MNCLNGHGFMPIKKTAKKITFRDVALSVQAEQHVCKVCGLEAGTLQQTAKIQQAILEKLRSLIKK